MSSATKENQEESTLGAELAMAHLQVLATMFSLLAGLMFSASILFFSFARELPYADIFTLLILTDGMLFICSIIAVNFMSQDIQAELWESISRWDAVLRTFAGSGLLLMMAILIGMALYLRWELGVVMFVLVVLCSTYIGYNVKKCANLRREKTQVAKTG